MAIEVKYTDNRFGTISNAYCKLIHYSGHKEKVFYSFQIYKGKDTCSLRDNNGNNDFYLKVINDSCGFDLDSKDNILVQCYKDFIAKNPELVIKEMV
jgi:hypothetical protein